MDSILLRTLGIREEKERKDVNLKIQKAETVLWTLLRNSPRLYPPQTSGPGNKVFAFESKVHNVLRFYRSGQESLHSSYN